MLSDENKKLCWEVLSKYGIEHQYYKIIEECSELQEATSHILQNRDFDRMENFREELVDVIVMCQQMLMVTGMQTEEVNRRAKAKLLRALNKEEKECQRC